MNVSNTYAIWRTHVVMHMQTRILAHKHTCFLSVSALTPCVFRAAILPPPFPPNCFTNMAAPPKDTIYAYWRATLLVTKGHTVKILNLWRTRTLSAPKYAEKAQKRCCVLCVWLYLLPSSFKQWPKGHYFIGLRCWLTHNVQKRLLFQTNIKAGLCMQNYPYDTHVHRHTHALYVPGKRLCALVQMPVGSRAWTGYVASLSCRRLWQADRGTAASTFPVLKTIILAMKECFQCNQLSVWVQGGIRYSHMLNVLPKHHWVGEEGGKYLRVLMLAVRKLKVYLAVFNPHC